MTPAEVLSCYWGYDSFRPVQEDIIRSFLSGRDTIGLMPTGGGKSLTFQVPAMIFDGLTLVVTPLVSLMKDQVDNLFEHGIRAVYLHSGLSRREVRLAVDRCRAGYARLIYVSPEKLSQQFFIDDLKTWHISAIVVDEAHCISQWGYDFRPSYLKIRDLRQLLPGVPVLALTASATPDVVRDIADKLQMTHPAIFSKSFDRSNLSYIVRHDEDKEGQLIRILLNTRGTAIVYVRSRRRTRELAEVLNKAGISADYYHAGLSPEDKAHKQDRWKSGETRVIVATNAFGMGIDKPDVRVVIHYDMPSSLEEYYQEAGRAGRDGNESYAVLLAAKKDKALLSRRLTDSFPPKDRILRVYELLGNFLDIVVGGGFNVVYEFNFDLFCKTFSLQPAMTRSALTILTRSGYIEYSDDMMMRSRVMILVEKSDFYNLDVDSVTDSVLQCLLRNYPGLFADYVIISESRVALLLNISEQKVYESLVKLSRLHVIHYIPRRETPYVYYPTPRQLPRYLVIPRAAYEDRREAMKERLEAMKRFAYDEGECRSRLLLGYFGEKEAHECGKCDYCRAKKAVSAPFRRDSDYESRLIAYLSDNGPMPVDRLFSGNEARRNFVAATLRALAEENLVRLDGNFVDAIKN